MSCYTFYVHTFSSLVWIAHEWLTSIEALHPSFLFPNSFLRYAVLVCCYKLVSISEMQNHDSVISKHYISAIICVWCCVNVVISLSAPSLLLAALNSFNEKLWEEIWGSWNVIVCKRGIVIFRISFLLFFSRLLPQIDPSIVIDFFSWRFMLSLETYLLSS